MNDKAKSNSITKLVRILVFIIGTIVIIILYTISTMFVPIGSLGGLGGLIRATIFIVLFSILWKSLKKIKIVKKDKNNYTFFIKRIFHRVFEINKGIFRILIIIFSISSVILGFITSGMNFWDVEEIIFFSILFTVLYFFLLWFSLWILLIMSDWIMKGFNEKK